MKSVPIKEPLMLVICAVFVFCLAACGTTTGGVGAGVFVGGEPHAKTGPPSHAPAHGYRAKHTYHYYPNTEVYFDISRELFFYIEGDGWMVSASLPRHLHARLGDYVVIEMDSATPHTHSKKHKEKYPPGQMKDKKGKKGKKW